MLDVRMHGRMTVHPSLSFEDYLRDIGVNNRNPYFDIDLFGPPEKGGVREVEIMTISTYRIPAVKNIAGLLRHVRQNREKSHNPQKNEPQWRTATPRMLLEWARKPHACKLQMVAPAVRRVVPGEQWPQAPCADSVFSHIPALSLLPLSERTFANPTVQFLFYRECAD